MKHIHLDKFNNEIILSINPRFYYLDYAMISAQVFTEICWVYFDMASDKRIIIYLKPKATIVEHTELELLGLEFFNYMLCVIKND